MVRFCLILSFFWGLCFANPASNLLGFDANVGNYTDENGNPNYPKITQILVQKSLLSLSYKEPVALSLKFSSSEQPLLLSRAVSGVLLNLGYRNYLVKGFSNSSSGAFVEFLLETEFLPSPGVLYNEFKNDKIFIKNINRISKFEYEYFLDLSKAKLKTDSYQSDENFSLNKPFEPYFFDISSKSSVTISSKPGDEWVPLVRVFDRGLNLLTQVSFNDKKSSINLKFPPNSKYMMIDDKFSLENIKRGLNIYIKSN